jgi:hypothetical protein
MRSPSAFDAMQVGVATIALDHGADHASCRNKRHVRPRRSSIDIFYLPIDSAREHHALEYFSLQLGANYELV